MQELIKRALKNHSFQVYYQPIWNVRSGKIDSAEALLRVKDCEWESSHIEERSVEKLIAAAEESGLILEIGRFVLEEVCRFMAQELPEKLGIRYIAVNLSAVQCEKEELTCIVKETLNRFQIRPEQIRFEITETAPIRDLSLVRKNMELLTEFGSEFMLDDYGSGFAGLAYLSELPAGTVKLDRSILGKAEKSEKAKIILESTVAMLQRLGFGVVAEGVENRRQKERLTALNCDQLQGYYFSKPLCGKEFITYCKAHKFTEVSTY